MKALGRIAKEVEASEVVMKGDYPYLVLPLVTGIPVINPMAFGEAVDAMCATGSFDCDLLIAPESMGIFYCAPISLKKGIPMLVVKKKSVLPDREVIVESRTGYSENRFHLLRLGRGTRVAIVDDVISTGGTVRALVDAYRDMGVIVTEVVCFLNKSKDVKVLEKEIGVPIRTVISIDIADGKAHLIRSPHIPIFTVKLSSMRILPSTIISLYERNPNDDLHNIPSISETWDMSSVRSTLAGSVRS